MSSKKGGAGYFVPEEAWSEFEDLIGIAKAFSAMLDGPERQILISSHSLRSVGHTLQRRLNSISKAAQFQPGTHQPGVEDGQAEQ